jgi:hypothetical protein
MAKKFLSRGPATVVYYVEQLNTDPELAGSQPAAACARRKLQKSSFKNNSNSSSLSTTINH